VDIAHCRGVTLTFLQNSRSGAQPGAAENASWSKQEAFAGYNPLTQHWQTMALATGIRLGPYEIQSQPL
jgi:hypothetical protein